MQKKSKASHVWRVCVDAGFEELRYFSKLYTMTFVQSHHSYHQQLLDMTLNITKAVVIWTGAFYLKLYWFTDFGDAGIVS